MSQYRTYMFNLPKISEAGESIPAGDPKVNEFSERQAALDFAAREGHEFERIAVMEISADAEQIIELLHDGRSVPVPQRQQPPQPPVTDAESTPAG